MYIYAPSVMNTEQSNSLQSTARAIASLPLHKLQPTVRVATFSLSQSGTGIFSLLPPSPFPFLLIALPPSPRSRPLKSS